MVGELLLGRQAGHREGIQAAFVDLLVVDQFEDYQMVEDHHQCLGNRLIRMVEVALVFH
jgi:hypothetical protein